MALTAQDIANIELLAHSLSGSIGDRTWSRNAHGQYNRARVTPADPQTGGQLLWRAKFAFIIQTWCNAMTHAQREAWRAFATRRTHPPAPRKYGRGRPGPLNGFNEFVRVNATRWRANLVPLLQPPPLTSGPDHNAFRVTATEGPAQVVVDYDVPQPYQFLFQAWVLVYTTIAYPVTIDSFKPHYSFRGRFSANRIPPVTIPMTAFPPMPILTRNQRIFFKLVLVAGDGRVAPPQRDRLIVTP